MGDHHIHNIETKTLSKRIILDSLGSLHPVGLDLMVEISDVFEGEKYE